VQSPEHTGSGCRPAALRLSPEENTSFDACKYVVAINDLCTRLASFSPVLKIDDCDADICVCDDDDNDGKRLAAATRLLEHKEKEEYILQEIRGRRFPAKGACGDKLHIPAYAAFPFTCVRLVKGGKRLRLVDG
jgi:hypothetical protein